MKPLVKVISRKEFKKRSGLVKGGLTVGNTIYATKDAGKFVMEHEKAHVELGHKPARLNRYQFIKRELKADKLATQRTGMKRYPKYYLKDIVNDTAGRFEITKKDARLIVNKEAKKLRLIKR